MRDDAIEYSHMPTSAGIYRLTNTVTGSFYIGAARNLYKRCRQHSDQIRRGAHDNAQIAASVYGHGVENFRFEVVEIVTNGQVMDRERYWIRKLRPELNGYDLRKKESRFKSTRQILAVPCNRDICDQIDAESSREGRTRPEMAKQLIVEALAERQKTVCA